MLGVGQAPWRRWRARRQAMARVPVTLETMMSTLEDVRDRLARLEGAVWPDAGPRSFRPR